MCAHACVRGCVKRLICFHVLVVVMAHADVTVVGERADVKTPKFSPDYVAGFSVVIGALDNIEARRCALPHLHTGLHGCPCACCVSACTGT
jgi:hypothetical protein